ncbi:hypothetical protein WI72_32095 [Burkholderia ubonensis]|uniref:hypothetical protein n=1 Tax=Burkholderia ubonensis TaxID=101571 RepID=UPI00075EEBC2|nr:hypothetical protein [Burkholderia ubonensis]KVC46283.1 hypothetical protein WI72_32095 [Burkholderia ubonensis]
MLIVAFVGRIIAPVWRFAADHWRATLALFAAAILFAVGWNAGGSHVRAQWQAEKAATATKVQKVEAKQAAVTDRVQVRYVDRMKVIRAQAQTLYKQVPFYVPASTPALPGSFRVLYDSAASGVPLPDPARSTDAAPVPPQDLARTDIDNLTGCRKNAEAVTAWQDWAAHEAGVTNGVTSDTKPSQ